MKKNIQLSFTLILIIPLLGYSQATLQWAYNFGSDKSATDQAYDVITDNENNVYITGAFRDSVDFDPGPGENFYYFSSDIYKSSAFIAKYTSEGEFVWAISIGDADGYGQVQSNGLAIDGEGNIICTGWVIGTVDFDPGPAVNTINDGIFLAKYDNDGNYMFAFSIGGVLSSAGKEVLIDDNDDIIVAGRFQGSVDFDPSGADYTITSIFYSGDLFIAKYSADGNFIFAKNIGATLIADNFDYGHFVTQDYDGNIFVTGEFSETTDFDPGTGVSELTPVGSNDLFVGKYDADMNFIWIKQITGDQQKEAHAITTDNDGNIYLAGWYYGQMDMDPGADQYIIESPADDANNMFFAKYTNAGELVWAKTIGGMGYDYARNIIVNDAGLIYIAGDFYSKVDFDPGAGVAMLSDPDADDIFLAVYNNDGNYLNASQIKSDNYPYEGRGMAMDLDMEGHIYLTGWFYQSADFDCTGGEYILTSGGDYDIYLAKYDSVIYTPTAIHEINTTELSVYPNPANDFVLINIPDGYKEGDIKLYNSNSEIVSSFKTVHQQQINIAVKNYPEGIYFLQMQQDDKIYYSKIFIAH